MAACVAQASPRAVGMIAGGTTLVGQPTDAWIRRMDHEGRVPLASQVFWHWFKGFDWLDELAAIRCPRLMYVGADHRSVAPRLRRLHDPLIERGVTVIEFDGLDDRACERGPALSARVVPAVVDWLDTSVGAAW
jgi:hypothetical protein